MIEMAARWAGAGRDDRRPGRRGRRRGLHRDRFLTNPARRGPDASAHAPAPPAAARPDPEAAPAVRRSIALDRGRALGRARRSSISWPRHRTTRRSATSRPGSSASAAFQGWWALRARRRSHASGLIDVGIAVNVAIVAAWAWTRTVGLPVGEFAGGPEPVGFPDAVCTAFEVLLVGVLLVARSGLDGGGRRPVVGRPAASIAVVPVLGLVLVLTSLSAVAIANGLDHGGTGQGTSGHVAGH